jgi:hypothetical protein
LASAASGAAGGLGSRGRAVAGAVRRYLREDRADLDGVALGEVDLGDRARCGGRHLGVHLVGGDLDDGLVGLDRVAFLLVPLEDRALGHGLAHRGKGDLDGRRDRHWTRFGD